MSYANSKGQIFEMIVGCLQIAIVFIKRSAFYQSAWYALGLLQRDGDALI